MASQIILHIDMDAFFASVEQAASPSYRGKPLIVGSRGKKYNTVVAACSYEAKEYGIQSGMPTATAFNLCPQAIFVAADSAKYMYTSDSIFELLKSYSDKMERASIDEFYLDLSKEDFEKAKIAARKIKKAIRQSFNITGSIGIAPAKIIAKIAAKAKKPDGLFVLEKENEVLDFLKGLPVEKVPGIGPHIKQRLNDMSIFTCGELADTGLKVLASRFGKLGFWLYEVSRGRDAGVVSYWYEPDEPPKSVSHSYTLGHELCRRDDLEAWILMLSEMVAYRLRKDRLEARTVCLCLKDRIGFLSREKKFSSQTSDALEIYKRSLIILDTFGLKNFCVRSLGVSASCLYAQEDLYLFSQDRERNQLISALDKINERFGEWSIYPARIKQVR
jgi:DNA polymerase-4